jgi:nascent polypeptide-associated complex subunit beta
VKSILKRYNFQPLPGISVVNFFKDDGTYLHFKKPEISAVMQSSCYAIFGTPETKEIKSTMNEVFTQLSTEQLAKYAPAFASAGKKAGKAGESIKEEKEDDDIPELKGANFDQTKKN